METKKLFKERRSVNFFDKKESIDENLLKEIINLAVLAPSAFNLQPWRIIAVKTPQAKEKLLKLCNNQEKVVDASVNLLIIGNKDGWSEKNPVWEEMLDSFKSPEAVNGAKQAAAFLYGSSEVRKLKFAESNSGLLAMSLMIAASEYGVSSHPMSGIDFDGIHKEFNLNDDEVVVMNIALGFFDTSKELYPRRPRRLFDQIVSVV